MIDWDKQLETFGGIFMYGFGDKVINGFIPAYLNKISLDDCYDYVENNKDLLAKVPEKYWPKLRNIARSGKINITVEDICANLEKNRPDLLSIIINHPKGRKWLADQVASCRQKLGYPD